MATIINTPAAPSNSGSNGMGFLFGIILLIVFVVFLIVYGAPYLRHLTAAPQINVPDKVDVNVNTSKQ